MQRRTKLPSERGPKRLRSTHFTMAALRAAGWKYSEIAKELKLSPHTVRATATSPLFKLEVERLTRKQTEAISSRYVDQVLQDGERNVTFLKDVRDGKPFDEPTAIDAMRIRMDSAKTLFDRQMPKRQEGEGQTTVTVILQPQEQIVMAEALRDVGQSIPQLDDVIAEFKRAEDETARADVR